MKEYVNYLVIVVGIIMIAFTGSSVFEIDRILKNLEYKDKEGQSSQTVNFKLIGAKKSGASILWIKHVLDVGTYEGREDVALLRNNAFQIAYLDPYFKSNYYFSGSVISFINTLKRPDIGLDILKKGLKYNPDDFTIKYYIAGIIAYNKNDITKLIGMFEEIVKVHRDDMIINVLAYVYEQKYKKSNSRSDILTAAVYWKMLLDSKDEEYIKKASKKLNTYKDRLQ